MKNKLRYLLIAALIVGMYPTNIYSLEQDEKATPPDTSFILMESSTGQVLDSQNEHAQLPIASVTKTMVLLLVAQEISANRLSFDDTVTASANASRTTGSVIWLEPGEVMTLGEMLKAIVISSANDACVAVAEHISGSEEAFVKRMNEQAQTLGLKNTHFTGCVGFDDERHYSSAYDVAVITSKLFEYSYFDEFYQTRLSSVRTGTSRETQLLNTNKLVDKYDGLIGGKTGTTDKAGYCLSVCAKRDNMKLIAVTLGAKTEDGRTKTCKTLLNEGFDKYERYSAVIEPKDLPYAVVDNGITKKIPLMLERPINCIIPKGKFEEVRYDALIPDKLPAPIAAGTPIGIIKASIGDEVIFESNIITADSSDELTIARGFWIAMERLFSL